MSLSSIVLARLSVSSATEIEVGQFTHIDQHTDKYIASATFDPFGPSYMGGVSLAALSTGTPFMETATSPTLMPA